MKNGVAYKNQNVYLRINIYLNQVVSKIVGGTWKIGLNRGTSKLRYSRYPQKVRTVLV